MRKFLPLAMFLTVGFISACQPDTPTVETQELPVETQAQAEVTPPVETLVFDASCTTENGTLPKSQLRSKLAELSALPDNYQLKDYGSLDLERSIFFGPQMQFKNMDNPERIEVKNFDSLLAQMSQPNFGKIKGTVDLGGRLYARATVEEYLFRTEDCARVAEDYLTWSEDTAGSKGPLYKTVRGVVRDGQAIYHISSGGFYMMDHQDELESIFRP